MRIKLIPIGEHSYAVCVGEISYHAGREYPWLGSHGGVCQYFSTEDEAKYFASCGKTESGK